MSTVALLGAGRMGEALLGGMLRRGYEVLVAESNPRRATELGELDGVEICTATAAVAAADLVIVAVKPQNVVDLIADTASSVGSHTAIVSVAAGISIATLERSAGPGIAVIRAMPNTPALLGEGMIAISPSALCSTEQIEAAVDLLSAVGRVVVVPESQQDAVTALSGSGPAYVFLVAEAMIDAAVGLGLEPSQARELATQTVFGAAAMLRESGDDPATLRANVTSPNGTTAAAIAALEEHEL
ncbi:MAG: pyrroline-5-carboxylate reductase, partial [Actinobacteria bacterium]|nr:pyrroline-5-carboxylate reductase [Actinomycetota bacterium]